MRSSRFFKRLKHFFYNKDGASGIEYAVIATMVAVVLAGFVPDVSKNVKTTFQSISDSLVPAKTTP